VSPALKLNKIIIIEDSVTILAIMRVVQEMHVVLVIEFRQHWWQRRDPRDVCQVVVIVTLLRAHHVKVSLLQTFLAASRRFLRLGAQHIRSRGKLPLAVPVS